MKDLTPKFLLVSLSVLTATGLFFTIFNWFDSLKIPFIARGNINAANLNASLTTNSDVANLLELQKKDTDLDTISDYDELYVYKTSPYIADSDSDGYPDGEEVKNNQDPNCPAGQVCNNSPVASASSTAPALPESADNLTSNQIRSLLLQSGATEQELKNISDSELQKMYQEVATEAAKAQAGSDVSNSDSTIEQASQLTPDQIRALLKEQGATNEELNKLSDNDLLNLWQEIIKEQQTQQ